MLEGLPALGQKREAALAQAARRPQQRIPGAIVNVGLFHAGGLLHRDVDPVTCAFVPGIGQRRHDIQERPQHRQDLLPRRGQVMNIARQHIRDPHRRPVRVEQRLDIPAAEQIHGYEPHCVPGLLQTADYAHALAIAGHPGATAEETGRRVALRLARQQILTRPSPPQLWVVIDEAVLHRPAGGRHAMRAQLTHLINATEQDNITLQVLPAATGPHPAMYGPFRIFRFPAHELPDIVYGENMTSAFYLDKPQDVTAYAEALDRLRAQAARTSATAKILRDTRKEY